MRNLLLLHIFHSSYISYMNLHGAAAPSLGSSDHRGLHSPVSLRLPFSPLRILLGDVSCIFHVLPLQERNQPRRACDLTPVPTTSSCTSQACHTHCRLQLTSSPTLSPLWPSSPCPREVGKSLERRYNGPLQTISTEKLTPLG